MPIEELIRYWPKIKFPVYTKITDPKYNDYEVGKEYEMRIDDEKYVEEQNESGPYNYIHECILISKEETTIGDIHPFLLAFDAHTRNTQEALRRLSPDENTWDNDTEIVMLIFLRKDKVKDVVLSDMEIIEENNMTAQFTKDDATK